MPTPLAGAVAPGSFGPPASLAAPTGPWTDPGLPDLLVVALSLATFVGLGVIVSLVSRRRSRLTSDASSATHRALHTASEAARHLRHGLTPPAAVRTARELAPLLGVDAVAMCDAGGPLAWEGDGAHHRDQLAQHAADVLTSGRTVRLDAEDVACPDPDCPIQGAILAPIVADDRVVAALGSYGRTTSTDLVRATEAVTHLISTQVELAELDRERGRVMEAELRALRAQISPHFVYNALAAIASFVRTDPERARELILEFADFTRYSFRTSEAYVTLADELGNVERYLTIEQARFGDRLGVQLRVAPEVLGVALPAFALQPLVENAVRHGIEARAGQGLVAITATELGPDAEIVVEDDGAGADPETIRALLAGEPGGDHVGLANVDGRLRAAYGDGYGLVVETAPGAGTKVSFRVPKFAAGAHV